VEKLIQKLAVYPAIGLDTAVFIYHLEAHPTFLPLTQPILSGLEQGRWTAVTSIITLMELNVRPFQLGRGDIARKYEALLINFPNLAVVEVGREVARRAAQLRAEFHLLPADALQVATSLCCQVGVFITNDRRLRRLKPVIDVVILEDYRQPD
jgi:predicted nucleic acid-binding protein